MATSAPRRPLVAPRRGTPTPEATPQAAALTPPADCGIASRIDGLPPRPSLTQLMEAAPALRGELRERARSSGLLMAWLAAVVVPAWTVLDRLLAPAQAGTFLAVRLLGDVPVLVALWLLWRRRLGRRPELLTFVVLATIQIEIAWMIPRVDDPQYYLLGFTLPLYASGCLVVSRPRWTAALALLSGTALATTAATAPEPMAAGDLVATAVFLATASLIAMVAHLRRYTLSSRELLTRIRLQDEQDRTRALLSRLERLSNEDPLTGLANRRRWDAELGVTCAEARRTGTGLAVALLDLDHFKRVNDRHGHAGGDAVLRQVADVLAGSVRAGDLVARLGGDELAVLLPGADCDRAAELAEGVRRAVAALQPPGFGPGEVSVSLGVAAVAGDEAFPVEITSRADAQLYRAKITRNTVGAAGIGGSSGVLAAPRGAGTRRADGGVPGPVPGKDQPVPAVRRSDGGL